MLLSTRVFAGSEANVNSVELNSISHHSPCAVNKYALGREIPNMISGLENPPATQADSSLKQQSRKPHFTAVGNFFNTCEVVLSIILVFQVTRGRE